MCLVWATRMIPFWGKSLKFAFLLFFFLFFFLSSLPVSQPLGSVVAT